MKKLSISPSVKKQVGISFAITILLGAITSIYFTLSAPQIPLFYSLALPSQQIMPKIWLFLLPGLSLVVSILHTIILQSLAKYTRIIQTLFSWSGIIFQILIFLSLIRIILITI